MLDKSTTLVLYLFPQVWLYRDVGEGGTVTQLSAEDADEGDNSLVTFELLDDPSQALDLTQGGRLFLAR